MPLLYYWRPDNYTRDLHAGVAFHLNQSTPRLHEIERGDSLWAFTRAPEGHYALAAELVVRAKTRNPPGFDYGPFRVYGDLTRSRYFSVRKQPDTEAVLRALSLAPKSRSLGQSFQGHAAVRHLTAADHSMLMALSQGLSMEPLAVLESEELLETVALLGEPVEPRRRAAERRLLTVSRFQRSSQMVADLRERYRGRCQLCGWDPRSDYAVDVCEGHHMHWLSRGGPDDLANLALLCPNHHRLVHRLDAPFDFADLSFDFGDWRQPVTLNLHLTQAA